MQHTAITEKHAELFGARLRQLGRQPATVDSYIRDSLAFVTFLEKSNIAVGDLNPNTIQEFQTYLVNRGIKENSLRRTVIGVRQFFRFLQDHFSWDQSPFDDAPIPARQLSNHHRIHAAHVANMLQKCKDQPSVLKALRDQALIYLLAHEGLKASELIQLRWHDFMYHSQGGRLRIEGLRPRSLSLEPETAKSLTDFRQAMTSIDIEKKHTASRSFMMIGFKGADAKHWDPSLTRHGVKFALYEIGDSIGMPHLNSEELRHYAMQHKVMQGMEPETIMNHFGLRTLGNIAQHLISP